MSTTTTHLQKAVDDAVTAYWASVYLKDQAEALRLIQAAQDHLTAALHSIQDAEKEGQS